MSKLALIDCKDKYAVPIAKALLLRDYTVIILTKDFGKYASLERDSIHLITKDQPAECIMADVTDATGDNHIDAVIKSVNLEEDVFVNCSRVGAFLEKLQCVTLFRNSLEELTTKDTKTVLLLISNESNQKKENASLVLFRDFIQTLSCYSNVELGTCNGISFNYKVLCPTELVTLVNLVDNLIVNRSKSLAGQTINI